MENEVADLLVGYLNASAEFSGTMGEVFPLVADEGTEAPYAVYRIDESNNETKDGAERFLASVILVFPPKQYAAALGMKNTVKAVLSDTEFYYQFSDTGFDEDTQSIVSIVSFQITST